MAPTATEVPSSASIVQQATEKLSLQQPKADVNGADSDSNYKYAWALPYANKDVKLPPLEPFDHVDVAHRSLKKENPRAFLDKATKVDKITPSFGTAVEGVQLDQLTPDQRDDLSLFVAQRGVVVFYDQDFIDRDPEWLKEFGSYFGRLHIHQTSIQPRDHLEFHLVYKGADKDYSHDASDDFNSVTWHSDVSYEQQPPGITFLFLFDTPDSGGDTLFADQRAAWSRLSPSFRSYLSTLQVEHSGFEQNAASVQGLRGGTGAAKRAPVKSVHPLVRTHPVTGEQALYVQPGFSRRILGLKKQESDAILNLLYKLIAESADLHARIRWRPRAVVAWDNRITAHTALQDFDVNSNGRRHGARITPQAEPPFYRSS